jgi:hypothetical protein
LTIAGLLGCFGSARVVVLCAGQGGEVASPVWTDVAEELDRDDYEYMLRDLRRTQGDFSFEPEV